MKWPHLEDHIFQLSSIFISFCLNLDFVIIDNAFACIFRTTEINKITFIINNTIITNDY